MKNLLLTVCICINVIVLHAQDTTRLSMLFVGDIMGHDSQIASAYDPATKQYDYTSCFQYVRPYLETPDLTIGNLEVTLAGPPHKGYPQFSSPDALAKTLKDVGFDVIVTANNHCVDRGRKGLERTVAILDSFNLPHTGTFVDTVSRLNDHPLLVEKNGFRLAILNYTFSTNGLPVYKPNIVNRLDTAIMRKDLLRAKQLKPDAIIVFTHWGVEYQSLPMKSQKDLTEFCFKHGAQLVIGAHPHVIQPMEWRKDKNQFVAYSLGNFVSGQRKRYTDGGAMAYVELEKINYKPDSAITTIDSAGYQLQWIYRDSKKDYYILPSPEVTEEYPLTPIKDATSLQAFKTFVGDSHQLFDKYNKDVREIDPTYAHEKAARENYSCAHKNALTTVERLAIYPFNAAHSVNIVSFDVEGEDDLTATLPKKNNVVDVTRLKENQILTKQQVDTLTDILFNYGYKGPISTMESTGCYDPRNAILFMDASGNVIEYFEICFKCYKVTKSSEKMSLGELCDNKTVMLKEFFLSHGITLGTKDRP